MSPAVILLLVRRERGPREGNEGRTDPEWSIMGLLGTKEKGDYSGARGALYNLLQRHALPRDGTGYRRGTRTSRGGGGLPLRADVLRPDALQHRLPEGGHPPGEALRRDLRRLRGHRRALRLLREHGPRALPYGRRSRRGRASRRTGRGTRPESLRALRVLTQKARRLRRRRLLPTPGDLPSDLPLIEDAQDRRCSAGAIAQRAGHRPRRALRGRGLHSGGQLLPDAHRGRTSPPSCRG